jgi:hypothetical protein
MQIVLEAPIMQLSGSSQIISELDDIESLVRSYRPRLLRHKYFPSPKSQRSSISSPFMLSNGPFLEFRLSVQPGQNCQAANGGGVGRKLLTGSNWWIEEAEPGCEREETILAIS